MENRKIYYRKIQFILWPLSSLVMLLSYGQAAAVDQLSTFFCFCMYICMCIYYVAYYTAILADSLPGYYIKMLVATLL